jgi:hypothetical protein
MNIKSVRTHGLVKNYMQSSGLDRKSTMQHISRYLYVVLYRYSIKEYQVVVQAKLLSMKKGCV